MFIGLVVFVDILYQVGEGPPIHSLLSVFIMNEYWILSHASYASLYGDVFFPFCFIDVMDCIN